MSSVDGVTSWNAAHPGPTVIALHGFTGVGEDFQPLAEAWGGPLLAPHLPGHRVPPPDPRPSFALAAQAEQVEALRRRLELERPFLWGYSYGGRIALQLLVEHSAHYRGAVLIGATPGIEDESERAARARDDDARADAIERDGVEAFLAAWQRRPIIASQARIDAGHRAVMASGRRRHTAQGLASALRGGGTGRMTPLWDRLAQVRCPVLLLTGAEDRKFTAIAARMQTLLPRAEHVVIDDAGHCAHLEQVGASLAAIQAWSAAL